LEGRQLDGLERWPPKSLAYRSEAASVGGLFLVGDDFQPTIDRQLKLFSGLVLSWVLAGFDLLWSNYEWPLLAALSVFQPRSPI
jgi:hypothetical protein